MSIFVSYRREDSQAITGRIDDHLRRNFGDRGVFRDIDSIPAGVDFVKHLEVALSECDVFVVVIGKRWTSQRLHEPEDYVRLEIEHALGKGIPVIPVLVEGASLPSGEDLPEKMKPLTRRQALKLDSGSDFRPHVDALVRSIRQNRKTDRKRAIILGAVGLAASVGVIVFALSHTEVTEAKPPAELQSPSATSIPNLSGQPDPSIDESVLGEPMSLIKAREVLDKAPTYRDRLKQYLFMVDLRYAQVFEGNPSLLIRRLESGFASPIVIDGKTAEQMLQQVRKVDEEYPKPTQGEEGYGSSKVDAMLKPVYEVIPTEGEAFAEILKAPKAILAAFLVSEYDANHLFKITTRIIEFLATGEFGKAPLSVMEKYLTDYDITSENEYAREAYRNAVKAGRKILGDDFAAWYKSVRGHSYEEDQKLASKQP
ncbi:MAG TPA: toll/interleukin-1 receptor domain-containing protein [Polyangiaceae bacterium]|nr:toll/interleukin-1 receptor domain-containing protein [Polyangiaceae bacterium]